MISSISLLTEQKDFSNGLYCDVVGEIGLRTEQISVRLDGTVVRSPLAMRKALVQYHLNPFCIKEIKIQAKCRWPAIWSVII